MASVRAVSYFALAYSVLDVLIKLCNGLCFRRRVPCKIYQMALVWALATPMSSVPFT